jgi:hypothetical protein
MEMSSKMKSLKNTLANVEINYGIGFVFLGIMKNRPKRHLSYGQKL